MKKILVWLIFLFVTIFVDPSLSAPVASNSQLDKAIRKIAPGASILTNSDVDVSSCGSKKNPGIIVADFKGEGKKNYAVLLKIGEAKNTAYKSDGSNRPWKKMRVWLVVFFSQADGSYEPVILEKIKDHSLPAYVFIKKIEPGVLREFDSDKKRVLKHPGIGLAFCEKSETVYYWDQASKKFQKIGISD